VNGIHGIEERNAIWSMRHAFDVNANCWKACVLFKFTGTDKSHDVDDTRNGLFLRREN